MGGDDSSNKKSSQDYKVGDVVTFNGGTHYVSSDATKPASTNLGSGKAKITIINKGSSHPYHLITQDWSATHVYGWVDEGSFS